MKLHYLPTLSPAPTKQGLSGLIRQGNIRDTRLERLVSSLGERFRLYSALCPFGLWAPGLHVTNEMRATTELYLPMEEIRRAFRRFLALALVRPPEPWRSPLDGVASWLDFLRKFRQDTAAVNPARLLTRLALDDGFRNRFLFTLFLPAHHGGSFHRYPAQLPFLERWLTGRRENSQEVIRCLDAACGTGEGTYDLAGLFMEVGIPPAGRLIHGCSIEPLEVFAAAHCCFPHDQEAELRFRKAVEPLFRAGCVEGMAFYRDDVTRPASEEEEPYDIIVCNGFLGGPFIHDRTELAAAVSSLMGRLRPGGLFLAADRFHCGWKRAAPPEILKELLKEGGLTLLAIDDGVAAQKGGARRPGR